ncbi:MAG: selenocysteine-specific translation elongation factor [Tissierella sp.]|nr:selenocysteine-specific translation elongation factor [Tissierella sp.]
MKHLIIGTAGHIDHGKTTLIKALTGRNTDRLKEEQKRGISIDLGFTYFDLPSGQRAGIIDVPGHEKFIKNMLAGVMGMDIVLLVVAADEGIMPQTKEHLSILNLLGINKGFVVLTKVDLVDEEWISLVEEEVEEETKGTFLEGCPIMRVSSTKNRGVKEVIHLIDEYVKDIEDRSTLDMARLPIDRVFTISGFGTVITGTLLSGNLKIGDEVQIYPGNETARIRTLQVHDENTEVAYAGQRVAVNLAGIKKDHIIRGDVLAPVEQMKETLMLDTKIKLLDSMNTSIKTRTRLRLYLGTKEIFCRIVLLDKEILNPGEESYAQLRLEEEIVAKRGDRFILRFYSPMFTIGGGVVLEPNPNKKRKLDKVTLEELKLKELGSQEDILENIIKEKSSEFLNIKELAAITAILEDELLKEVNNLYQKERVVIFNLTKDTYPVHINYFNKIKEDILDEIKEFHSKYPLRQGITKELIRTRHLKNAIPKVGEVFIQSLLDNGIIAQDLEVIKLKDFNIEYDENQLEIKQDIFKEYEKNLYMIPRVQDIINVLKYNKDNIDEVFNSLLNTKELIRLDEEIYIQKDLYNKAISKLKDYITENGSITVAEFRDLLNTNRKIALILLESFDQQGITKREENKRILTSN